MLSTFSTMLRSHSLRQEKKKTNATYFVRYFEKSFLTFYVNFDRFFRLSQGSVNGPFPNGKYPRFFQF